MRESANLFIMRKMTLPAMLVCALVTPALADDYPVSGSWGQSTSSAKGTINCGGKRVITFDGNQRTDSNGGVPAYRNRSVEADGASAWRVIDIFTTGQISNAQAIYTLRAVKDGQLEMTMQPGGMIRLQKCK